MMYKLVRKTDNLEICFCDNLEKLLLISCDKTVIMTLKRLNRG
jgi:hypothetical protein